ncbi:hypothetical protein CKF54_06510 [Psittacicella hinzii]|uniref:Uncharacterized protein n=1 Tax=Psittacicella hinzii TaxID=2028575 RepID=A0A3A1Y5S0_9GAMM|nr:NAD(P)H-binding protein [Psittacicella hinzii]RIY31537.1 hypothetical protein CKF54_06510 [Psittacicella hinzii]
MKVLVLSSNGKVGTLVAKELLARGHQVTGNSHSANRNAFITNFIEKDIRSLTKEDVAGYDAVVCAYGAFGVPNLGELFASVNQHLLQILEDSPAYLYVVGGAGAMIVDAASGTRLVDTPDFPEVFFDLASAQANSLRRDFAPNKKVNWVFVSPAVEFDADAPLTKNVAIAGPFFSVNNQGESFISYADYAWELVNQIEARKFNRAWINFRQGDK